VSSFDAIVWGSFILTSSRRPVLSPRPSPLMIFGIVASVTPVMVPIVVFRSIFLYLLINTSVTPVTFAFFFFHD
jgi:hypothetical protein